MNALDRSELRAETFFVTFLGDVACAIIILVDVLNTRHIVSCKSSDILFVKLFLSVQSFLGGSQVAVSVDRHVILHFALVKNLRAR